MLKKKEKPVILSDTDEIVRTEKVSKLYGEDGINSLIAVDRVSLSVKKGEFVAVIGTSGSGKSTLLHMIGGVEKPTRGKVFIRGCDIYELSESQLTKLRCKEIGVVYQFFNLIPVLNVEENIAFPVIAAGETPDFKKIREIMKKLNIENKGSYFPNQLSGGQQQRVAIGRAIVTSPSVILADEPTGNLDSKNSAEVMDILVSLCKDLNKTLIVITHDEKIAQLADRIIRIEDGKIASDSEPEGEAVIK